MSSRLEQLQKMYAADQGDAFITYAIAMELEKAGDTAGAIEWLDRTLGLDADYAYGYYQKGRLLIADGRMEDARIVLREGEQVAVKAGDDKAVSELRQLLQTIG